MLPLPDPALWSVPADAGEVWVPYQTRRGCPMKCSYCSTPALEGTSIRMHAVEQVIDGIAKQVAAGYGNFYFVDNTFNFPLQYAKELCSALGSAGLDLRWRWASRPYCMM